MKLLNLFALFTWDNDFVVQKDGHCVHTTLVKFFYCTR